MDQMMMQGQGMQGGEMDSEGEGGVSVTIDKLPSGAFTVRSGAGEPVPVKSIDEALQKADAMLQGAPSDDESAGQVQAGYDRVAGKRPMAKRMGGMFGE